MQPLFNRTHMMDETKAFSKPRNIVIELIILFAIFMIINFVQNLILMPALMIFMYGDDKFIELITAQPPDINALFTRMFELLTIVPEWIMILSVALSAVIIIAVLFYCKFIDKRPIKSLGLRKGRVFGEYLAGFLTGAIAIAVSVAVVMLCGAVEFSGINTSVSPLLLLLYLVAYIIYGMAYELLIHGQYMMSVTKNASVTYALVVSSFAFAVISSTSVGVTFIPFLNMLVLAGVTGVCVIKRGNIWCAAGFHAAWCFCQNVIFSFTQTGVSDHTHILRFEMAQNSDKLHGGVYGLDGSLASLLILFLLLGVFYKLKDNKNELSKSK